MIAALTGVRWYIIVFLFSSTFSCTCWLFIFFRKASRSFTYFPIGLFAGFFVLFCFWVVWILYIFWILHLIRHIVCKDFSLSIHCLFTLIITSFVVQRLLFWMVSLVHFYFDAGSLGVISRKFTRTPVKEIFPIFSFRCFMVSGLHLSHQSDSN